MTDQDPKCDKCGAPVTTGMMAAICPRAEKCEFWPADESSQEFVASLRQPRLDGGKTGWPPGLLQDDSKGLSRWLASKPDAREVVRKLASTESMPDYTATAAIRQDGEPS